MSRQAARRIWTQHNGPIPIDDDGFSFEIHHINGDSSDNRIENLLCISIKEHYQIHYDLGDFGAAWAISCRMSDEYKFEKISEASTNSNQQRVKNGTHNFLKANRNTDWHNTNNPETRKKIGRANTRLSERENVSDLRELVKFVGIKLGSGWTKKSDEWVEEQISQIEEDLIHGYGL